MPDIRRYRRAILVLYLVLLLAATLTPVTVRSGGVEWLDKVAHALLFGVLAVLFYWNATHPSRLRSAIAAAVLSTLCAGLVELLQMPVPERSGEVWDFVVGAVAAAAASAAAGMTNVE